MRRDIALPPEEAPPKTVPRPGNGGSLSCLLFVVILMAAFWCGALWANHPWW